MTNPARLVADALATALAGLTLAQPHTAARCWIPAPTLRETLTPGGTVQILVAPSAESLIPGTRDSKERTITVDVAVIAATTGSSPAAVDALADLAETVFAAVPTVLALPALATEAYQTGERLTPALPDRSALQQNTFFALAQFPFIVHTA